MRLNWTCATDLNSSASYLIRAINEWILDNGCTPYLVVDASVEAVCVPMEHVKDGQIVLNISPQAIRDLSITEEYVIFSGRFSGVAYEISAPVSAVLGIIAKENGEGMWFPKDEQEPTPPTEPRKQDPKRPPNLKVVK